MALPTLSPGHRLVSGEDLIAIVNSIAALAAANSVALPAVMPVFQLGPRTHRGESVNILIQNVQAIATALSASIPTLRPQPVGSRLTSASELNTLVGVIRQLGGS